MGKIEIGEASVSNGAGLSFGRGWLVDFEVAMFAHGFEASRTLNADELREIRDWINRELGDGE